MWICISIFYTTGQSQSISWDASNGSVTVSGGPVTFSTYIAPTDENVKTLMTHANLFRVWHNRRASIASGITAANMGADGTVTVKVFAYDKTARGKGALLYGCSSTQNGLHEDAWNTLVVNSVDPSKTAIVKSNNLSMLASQLLIYYPAGACTITGKPERALQWAAPLALSPVRPLTKFFTAGKDLTTIWDTTASALNNNLPDPGKKYLDEATAACKTYYTPLQPVIVEVTVKNATVNRLTIPGPNLEGRNSVTPYELFNVWYNTDYSNLFRRDQPTVMAHRAYWRNAGIAQNSSAAIQAAADRTDIDAIEIDVRSTSDTAAICFHDDMPQKVLQGTQQTHPDASVYDLLLDTLVRYKLYDRFDLETTETLLTLEAAFRYIRDHHITKPINLDIGIPDQVPQGAAKVSGKPFYNAVFRQAVGAACRYGLTDKVIFKGKYTYNDSIWLSVQDTLRQYYVLNKSADGVDAHPIIAYTPKLGDDITDSVNYRNDWLDIGKGRGIPFLAVVGMEVRLKTDGGSPEDAALEDFLKASIDMVKATDYNATTPLRAGVFSETPTSCQGYWTKSAAEKYVNFDDDNRNNFDWVLNHGYDYVITDIPEVLTAIINARK